MGTSKFDISDYLDSEEMIAEYLNTILEDGDIPDLIASIEYIEKSIKINKIKKI